MNISVFYHHVKEAAKESRIPIKDILKDISSTGVKYLDIELSHFAEITNIIEGTGMSVASVYSEYDLARKGGYFKGRLHVNTAKALGCKSILIVPGLFTSADKNVREKEQKRMIRRMKRICAYAKKKGIHPTIEDYDNAKSPVSTMAGMKAFLDAIPSLMVSFDTGNFMYSAEDELEAYELFKDRIVHVHCKDRGIEDNGTDYITAVDGKKLYAVPVGSGVIKMRKVLTKVDRTNYDGIYTMEFFGAKNYLDFIKESYSFMTSVF